MFQRIESIQLKTELKLKMDNPFKVHKKLLSFNYDIMINILKQNLNLSNDLEDIFRFLTEHLFVLLSNEINIQYNISCYGQDVLIPILINCFVLSLIGKNKVEENIFDIIKTNLETLTLADDKINVFYLIDEVLNVAFNYLYKKKTIKKLGIVGDNKSGKKLFIKKILKTNNFNNTLNFFNFKQNTFIYFPNEILNNTYFSNYLKHMHHKIYIIDSRDFELIWINFINKNTNWNLKKLNIFFIKFLELKNINFNYDDIYFINKTDIFDISKLNHILVGKKKPFLLQVSKYFDICEENISKMNDEEINHMINFIIKCGKLNNFIWGSLHNGTNLKLLNNIIDKL